MKIDVSPIRSLFCNMNLDNNGTGDESTLVKRRPNDSEFLDLDAKIGKSGIEEVKTLHSNEPTILDFKEFNYDNCSLIDFFLVAIHVEILLVLTIKIKLLLNMSLML